jgi:hypothetical protein
VNSKYGPLFSIEHKDSYMDRYIKANIPISGLCFNNRFAWSVDRFYRFLILEDCVCLYCEGEEGITKQHLVYPLGELTAQKLKNIIDFYYPVFEEQNNPMKIMFVPAGRVESFMNIDGYDAQIVHKEDFDEYVYDIESLKDLKGKTLKSKKNQLNRFFRECTSCEYITLTKDNMEECLALTEEWCKEKGIEKEDLLSSDYIPIKILFENFDRLDIRGGAIKLFKKMIAFSLGSDTLGDTAFIHFEKVDHVISGANVAIVNSVLENEYTDAKFINREEDMGIEGLRIAKQSYDPAYMTEKYDVFLTKR